MSEYKRKFLVVIDESKEADRAITFAANRVKRTGGTVVLLWVIDSQDFTQFLGVEEVMRAEAREEAERLLDSKRARIGQIGEGIRTETVIREGDVVSEIERLVPSPLAIGARGRHRQEGPAPGQRFATRAARRRCR